MHRRRTEVSGRTKPEQEETLATIFSDTVYPAGNWATVLPGDNDRTVVVISVFPFDGTFNGTVNAVGDVVSNPNFGTATATNLDDAGFIVLDSGGTLILLSNSPLATEQEIVFSNATFDNSYNVPCFAAGTRIATTQGEVRVEALREGDVVLLAGGGHAPIRWVGHRVTNLARHPRPWDVQPVRIVAHAFGPGLPHTDVRLSPDHAVYWDGVLIPIRYLANGATIIQETVEEIIYYHVELAGSGGAATHDVVFAHGLTVESYLDTGNRGVFANGGPVVTMHPDFARDAWEGACAPLVLDGPVMEALRVTLLAQATTLGHALSLDPDLHLVVDGTIVEGEREGVAYRFALPAHARDVRLVSRSTVPAETRADSSDIRRLGVAVTRLILDGTLLALDDPRLLGGWKASEGDWRWTSGNAALAIGGSRMLEVTIARLESYWIRTAVVARRTGVVAA
jgi:hypothetical protein